MASEKELRFAFQGVEGVTSNLYVCWQAKPTWLLPTWCGTLVAAQSESGRDGQATTRSMTSDSTLTNACFVRPEMHADTGIVSDEILLFLGRLPRVFRFTPPFKSPLAHCMEFLATTKSGCAQHFYIRTLSRPPDALNSLRFCRP